MPRLKYAVKINPSKREVSGLPTDTEVSFLPMDAVSEHGVISPENRKLDSVNEGFTYFRNGDVVMAKITPCFENGKGAAIHDLASNIGFGTTEFLVMRPLSLDPKYLYYIISSHQFRKYGETEMRGSAGQKRVPESYVANYQIDKLTIAEQQKRAKLLDEKSAAIDRAIEQKRKLIDLLKEKRTAIINRAVTRGLDENVELVDSDVEWIGKVPKGWKMRKFARSFNLIGSGATPSSGNEAFYEDGDIDWVVTGDLNDRIVFNSSKKITKDAFSSSSALKIYPRGTLLVAMYGATIGKVGLLDIPACTNQACCAIGDSPFFENKFVYYWFLINRKNIVDIYSYGSGQPNISQDTIKRLHIQAPSIDEQRKIVIFLDNKMNAFSMLISKVEKSIELLTEYRASLISHVVTGKVKI